MPYGHDGVVGGRQMNLTDKRFLVAGLGKSGIAAAELLQQKGISFCLYDGNKEFDKEAFYQKNPSLREIMIFLGEVPGEQKEKIDILVLSPGIATDLPMVDELRKAGAAVWGEIELAYAFAKGRLLAVTGTNGKTTTTALLGEILKNYFADVKVVGNIGIPYTSVAADTTEETVTAAEISSFQLETIHTFAPCVTAILNITPDHLNRHHTMENYRKIKENITKNQTKDDLCVLNYEDEALRDFGERLHTKVMWFSSRRKIDNGLYLEGDTIFLSEGGALTEIVKTGELNLLGRHNYENVMAAVAMALGIGVPLSKIREVLFRFTAVEHRIEYVAQKRGVRFYNDSKATNPDAAIQGIGAMNCPTYLIGGGCDKGSAYDEWIDAFGGKVKELILIGQTREKIAKTAREHGFFAVAMADSLEDAVRLCYEKAVPGDAVLLSPACASFGMFLNYEERGRIFKEIVRSLEE